MRNLRGCGVTLLILGIGSFVLPLMGLQFKLVNIFGHGSQPVVGIAMIVIGGFILLAAGGAFRLIAGQAA